MYTNLYIDFEDVFVKYEPNMKFNSISEANNKKSKTCRFCEMVPTVWKDLPIIFNKNFRTVVQNGC